VLRYLCLDQADIMRAIHWIGLVALFALSGGLAASAAELMQRANERLTATRRGSRRYYSNNPNGGQIDEFELT
jgi:hypothetical protein